MMRTEKSADCIRLGVGVKIARMSHTPSQRRDSRTRATARLASRFDTTTPVLVLKIDYLPLHHGRLGVIRTLGRVGVPVYGVHEDRFTPSAVSKYLQGRFLWVPNSTDAGELPDGLVAIAERLERPAIAIATDDVSAILLADHADQLARWFRFPRQDARLARTLADKWELYLLCRRLGIPCPEAMLPASWGEARDFARSSGLPVVAKIPQPWLVPKAAGVKSSTIVPTVDDLSDLYRRLGDQAASNLMLQEHIPVGEDWVFHGYCDASSTTLAGFTGVKLRSYPAYAGPTTLGRCVANEELREQAEWLFKAVAYRGIMDLDYRLDLRDGQYKLLDFNPRVGAQFRLFEDDAGMDVVRALHLDLTGRPVPRGRPIEGRAFMVETGDLLSTRGYHRAGALTWRSWLRSLRGVREFAWFARDDLVPLLAVGVRFGLRGIERPLGIERTGRRALSSPRFLPGRRGGLGRRQKSAPRTG
jgi:predicted ATP-grasp superfamily ATP-dependent carboligase